MYEQLFLGRWHLGKVKLGIFASSVLFVIFQLSSICCHIKDAGAYLKMGKMVSERRNQVGKCIKFRHKLQCHYYVEETVKMHICFLV